MKPAETVSVLSVSPMEEDHSSLRSIFTHTRWKLFKTHGLGSALAFLKVQKAQVVLCESDLRPGTWKDLLAQITPSLCAPAVVVGSRLADDQLWAEALNLGAWDVLTKPYVPSEVFRVVSGAWRHWMNQQESRTATMKVKKAAG